jgi:hypothetical protein
MSLTLGKNVAVARRAGPARVSVCSNEGFAPLPHTPNTPPPSPQPPRPRLPAPARQ